jgi:phytol kinase
LDELIRFFSQNTPSPAEALQGGPPAMAFALVGLWLAGWLRRRGWPVGYSRKVFHVLIFLASAVVHAVWGLPSVCLFGASVSLVVFWALWRGPGHWGYEALARASDAPHRSAYVLLPWFATALGGITANVWFGPAAVVGYLVTGLGDAIGEPVGQRFGVHRYRVPWPGPVVSQRSLEGSAAVWVACALAGAVAVTIEPSLSLPGPGWVGPVLALGLLGGLCALVEAVSPHGWDNLTMQLIPSAAAFAWLSQGG